MASLFDLTGQNDIAGISINPSSTGRVASVYSEVQASRINHALPLPSVLKNPFKIIDGPPSSAAGHPEEIEKLFPNLYGQPSALLVPNQSNVVSSDQKLKIGVVLSGGQAPGGHNVICGIFDYLKEYVKGSTLFGFRGGPAGIMKGKYTELTSDFVYPYRNQVHDQRCLRSEVFKMMLEPDKCKASSKLETITLSEMKQEELEAFVEFIYSDGYMLSEKGNQHVRSLYCAARNYEIFAETSF